MKGEVFMSNNFTAKAEAALNRAVALAEENGHVYIGTEHVLLALAEDETCCASILMKKHKLTFDRIYNGVKEYSGIGDKSKLSSKDTTPKCRRLLESSYKIAKKYGGDKIGTEHLLLSVIEEKECVASKILTKIEADTVGIKESVISFLRTSQRGVAYAEPVSEVSLPNLSKYGKNISAMAERGELDPVIGRDAETDRLIRILSRRSKNNPCLIGEAGVGKTAIVEGLAERINEGRVPSSLAGKIIFSIDLTSMVAGAKYRGDFEERIKNIMNEASKNKSVILFIDEIHTIVGAGSAEGAIDAANIMKPELSRGDIQLIGATTLSEYRKYIEKDAALERRFQPLIVEETSIDKTIGIIRGIKDRYERHHGVILSDEAITEAVRLSARYINDRFLPDKAIDVIDEACAYKSVKCAFESEKTKLLKDKIKQTANDRRQAIFDRDYELAVNLKELEKLYCDELCKENSSPKINYRDTVDKNDIHAIIREITGIDVGGSADGKEIRQKMAEVVFGQGDAINSLSNAVLRSYAGINSPDKPRGVFLFLGESGVGKTALASALAEAIFHSKDALIRYDMSEYAEPYSVSKLIGSAPGYVGYDEQNTPLERIRKHPYSVILFDEIEKAHPDVMSLFLQIFDNGYLTDAIGRKINFRNTYIIMTSNIGADKFRADDGIGFAKDKHQKSLQERLRGQFKDEFINRIDEIILFNPLDSASLTKIARIKVDSISQRLKAAGIDLKCDERVYEALADMVKEAKGFGARPINRLILTVIENKIAEMIINEDISSGDELHIYTENGKILFKPSCYVLK